MASKKAAIAAVSVLGVMAVTFLLLRELPSRYVMIVAYTSDAGGLSEGTSVRLNGISVGDLDRLTLTRSRDPNRKIEFVMKIQRRYLAEIPDDSLVAVAATNMLGNYFIDIIHGRSAQPVQPGGELRTTASADPNRLMGQMASEFQQIQAILTRADSLITDVESGQGNIGMWQKEGLGKVNGVQRELTRLTASINSAHGNLSKIGDLSAQMDSVNNRLADVTAAIETGQGTAARLKTFSDEMGQMNTEMAKLTADLNSPQGPSARISTMQQNLDGLSASVQSTMDHINSGQGTLGQLTVNPQFSEALQHTGAEFQALAQGIRTNPRKFLSLQVKFF